MSKEDKEVLQEEDEDYANPFQYMLENIADGLIFQNLMFMSVTTNMLKLMASQNPNMPSEPIEDIAHCFQVESSPFIMTNASSENDALNNYQRELVYRQCMAIAHQLASNASSSSSSSTSPNLAHKSTKKVSIASPEVSSRLSPAAAPYVPGTREYQLSSPFPQPLSAPSSSSSSSSTTFKSYADIVAQK